MRPLGPKRRLEENELGDLPVQGSGGAVGKRDRPLRVSGQGEMGGVTPEFQGDALGDHAGTQLGFEGAEAIALPSDSEPKGLRAFGAGKRAKPVELKAEGAEVPAAVPQACLEGRELGGVDLSHEVNGDVKGLGALPAPEGQRAKRLLEANDLVTDVRRQGDGREEPHAPLLSTSPFSVSALGEGEEARDTGPREGCAFGRESACDRPGKGRRMTVSIDWDVEGPRWRSLLQDVPRATFFHTPGWYQTHADRGGFSWRCVGFRWPDGQEALLPLAIQSRFRGWVQEASAGVESGYGGLMSPHALPPHRVDEAYALVRARYPNLRVLGNPLGRQQSIPTSGKATESFTQVVPVLDPEAQLARMSEMRRRNFRKAERVGFELERVHPVMPSDARDVFPVYQEHSSRWTYRRWVRDEAYFRSLFRHGGQDLVLFLARHEGEVAGFVLLGAWGETLVELHLSTREVADRLQVGTFLIVKPLEWAYQAGYRDFDFLASGALEGIVAYKESFGAERVRQVEVVQDSLWSRGLSTLRRAVTRERLVSSH